jgi:hypothetical protein
MPCSLLNITDVLEKHVTSIFRVEEYTKQETSMKPVAGRVDFLLGLIFDPEYGSNIFLQNTD